ncbi:hypothetical protein [Maritimibacter sp. UBA3975]|uniref:hypothetical protein n=1 Tax=Maritimibacter sp. UBA3975 TaxID=1946833 RepID=UPI000C097327|nr:hypothetical protein [Maritimibacter sp. UBA3975]MAM61666.1 hypothetical protein [Maritimibacter sp.]|tara:strand:- start:5800 stop:5991 length:192 start_codon:yes stop_codon:yes gene_type:complete
MSAPDTSLEREQRRHAPALVGIALAVLIGGIMGAAMTYWAIERSDTAPATEEATSDATGMPVD